MTPSDGQTGASRPGRLPGVDALRCSMIVVVVALHAAMSYMAFAPEWWYIVDARRNIVFTALVILLDTFPMTVLFLLAGYFAPSSLGRSGVGGFMRAKLFRLGLPWLLGMVLVVPFLARASMLRYGLPDKPLFAFVREDFFGIWYQQGHFWFLCVLLAFMALYAALSRPLSAALRPLVRPNPPSWLPAAAIAATALAFFLSSRHIVPPDDWIRLCWTLYFQPARITGYVLAFLFGILARTSGWFADGSWRPSPARWGIAAAVTGTARLAWKLFGGGLTAGIFVDVLEAVLYAAATWSITLFLLGAFLRFGPTLDSRLRRLSPYSFGIYWWHQCILPPVTYLLLPFSVPAVVKFAVACAVTLVAGRFLAQAVDAATQKTFFARRRKGTP